MNENPLEGASFGIFKYDETTNTMEPCESETVTNQGNKFTFNGLEPYQNYAIKETKSPDGYKLNNNYFVFMIDNELLIRGKTINGDGNVIDDDLCFAYQIHYGLVGTEKTNLYLQNRTDKVTKLTIKKIDEDGNYLPNAYFKLRDYMEGVVYEPVVENEEFVFNNLPCPGQFKLLETKTPTGYAPIDDTNIDIESQENDTYKLVVNSVDDATKVVDQNDFYITVTNYKKGNTDVIIKKFRPYERGVAPLDGADFKVIAESDNKEYFPTKVDGNTFEFKGLTYPEKYRLYETKVPDGYFNSLNKQEPDGVEGDYKTITINRGGVVEGFKFVHDIDRMKRDGIIERSETSTTIGIINKPLSLHIYKLTPNERHNDFESIEGVMFDLFRSVDGKEEYIQTYETDWDGEIEIPHEQVLFKRNQHYVLKEKYTPEGKQAIEPIEFYFDDFSRFKIVGFDEAINQLDEDQVLEDVIRGNVSFDYSQWKNQVELSVYNIDKCATPVLNIRKTVNGKVPSKDEKFVFSLFNFIEQKYSVNEEDKIIFDDLKFTFEQCGKKYLFMLTEIDMNDPSSHFDLYEKTNIDLDSLTYDGYTLDTKKHYIEIKPIYVDGEIQFEITYDRDKNNTGITINNTIEEGSKVPTKPTDPTNPTEPEYPIVPEAITPNPIQPDPDVTPTPTTPEVEVPVITPTPSLPNIETPTVIPNKEEGKDIPNKEITTIPNTSDATNNPLFITILLTALFIAGYSMKRLKDE